MISVVAVVSIVAPPDASVHREMASDNLKGEPADRYQCMDAASFKKDILACHMLQASPAVNAGWTPSPLY